MPEPPRPYMTKEDHFQVLHSGIKAILDALLRIETLLRPSSQQKQWRDGSDTEVHVSNPLLKLRPSKEDSSNAS